MSERKPSKRAGDFTVFGAKVVDHIEHYTVPQYGDAPNDQAEEWTAADCVKQAQKYMNRFGRNSRHGQQELDFLKAAHYIQLAYDKYIAEQQALDEGDEVQLGDK